jgi:hypothetical protein
MEVGETRSEEMGRARRWRTDCTYQVIQNLVPDDGDHLKALWASHAVDEQVAV